MMIEELKGIVVDTFHIIIASEAPTAQIFSGNVSTYKNECIDYFARYYKNQNYNQEILNELYGS